MQTPSSIWKKLLLVCCQSYLCHFSFKPSGISCTFEKVIVRVIAVFPGKKKKEYAGEVFSLVMRRQTWLWMNEQSLKQIIKCWAV